MQRQMLQWLRSKRLVGRLGILKVRQNLERLKAATREASAVKAEVSLVEGVVDGHLGALLQEVFYLPNLAVRFAALVQEVCVVKILGLSDVLLEDRGDLVRDAFQRVALVHPEDFGKVVHMSDRGLLHQLLMIFLDGLAYLLSSI